MYALFWCDFRFCQHCLLYLINNIERKRVSILIKGLKSVHFSYTGYLLLLPTMKTSLELVEKLRHAEKIWNMRKLCLFQTSHKHFFLL